MQFKKGDIVKVICSKGLDNSFKTIKLNQLYLIDYYNPASEFVYLKSDFNNPNVGGWFPSRFKKINKKNLTEKERFEYIKYKLGVRND